MFDREKLNMERDETERNVLNKITKAFETGFDEVCAYDGVERNITSFVGLAEVKDVIPPFEEVKTILHCEVKGFGETPDEALADWQEDLNKRPQAGRALLWRVRPEMDWARDFDAQKTKWKVYARFSVDGPR